MLLHNMRNVQEASKWNAGLFSILRWPIHYEAIVMFQYPTKCVSVLYV